MTNREKRMSVSSLDTEIVGKLENLARQNSIEINTEINIMQNLAVRKFFPVVYPESFYKIRSLKLTEN